MATRYDVTARLAEGLPVVDDAQTYVTASQLRGYHHPDLTLHGAQVRDWYGTEDGLDLRTLDADCSALKAAADAAAEALRIARAQDSALTAAWSGEGAAAASGFLARHLAEATVLAAAVATAASALAKLRDTLWELVDAKVETTISINERVSAQRPAWLPAARAVLTGTDGNGEAGAVVDGQVKPFVQEHLQDDWVTAMRAARSDVESAYRGAVTAIGDRRETRFDVPGQLGPRYVAPAAPPAVAMAPASASAVPSPPPAALGSQASPMEVAPPLTPMPATPPSAMTAPPPAAMGTGAMPDFGAATAIPARMADALGGLLGSSGAGAPDPSSLPELDPPELPGRPDEPIGDMDEEETDADIAEEEGDEEVADDVTDQGAEEAVAEAAPEPAPEPTPDTAERADCPEPEPEPAPVVEAPPPPAAATPCEIAADELPQAGQ